MKIVITGSNGYIGSTLVKKLQDIDYDIYLIDIKDWDIRTVPMEGRLPHRCDVVVHLAALVKVGESVEKPWDYYNTNVFLFPSLTGGGSRYVIISNMSIKVLYT